MRQLRIVMTLAGSQMRTPWFWLFITIFAAIGPLFIVLESASYVPELAARPLLSEPASVAHFDQRSPRLRSPGVESAIQILREPVVESAPAPSIGEALNPGYARSVASYRGFSMPWSLQQAKSISSAYRVLLPLLMVALGVLAFPSRRRLSLWRTLAPLGRGGCFAAIAAGLVVEVLLLGLMSFLFMLIAVALVPGLAAGSIGILAIWFGAVILYSLGLAFVGLVLSELCRCKDRALLIGLTLIVGAWWLVVSLLPAGYWLAIRAITGPGLQGGNLPPLVTILGVLLDPPERAFEIVALTLQRLSLDEPFAAGAYDLGAILIRYLAGLLLFAGTWFVVGWLTFPRKVLGGGDR